MKVDICRECEKCVNTGRSSFEKLKKTCLSRFLRCSETIAKDGGFTECKYVRRCPLGKGGAEL